MLHRPRDITRVLLYCGSLYVAATGSAAAADPTGDWRVADGVANIRVAECNGSMWGAVAWEKQPGGVDSNNPDAAKRTRPTLGMPILLDMKKKPGVDEWEGEAYDAKTTGHNFKTTIKLKGTNQLEINGCFLFICSGETWTRVSGPIPSSNGLAKGAKAGVTKMAAAPKPVPPKAGQKNAMPGQPADIGDICLLPDIAGLAH